MILHNVKHDGNFKLWCGLAVMSAISGLGTNHCKGQVKTAIDEKVMTLHETYEKQGRRRAIKGIYVPELLRGLKHLGFESREIFRDKFESWTLARTLHKFKPNKLANGEPAELFGILIPGHYMVTDGVRIVDSMRKEGCALFDHPFVDEPCIALWSITSMTWDDL